VPSPIFDAHLHVVDPAFPLVANAGYVPDPFTAADYLERTAVQGVTGGAVVAASFQAGTEWLLAALSRLGPRFVGVAALGPDVPDAEVLALDVSGVRAVRVNLHRGGRSELEGLETLAARVHVLSGWHVEVYADGAALAALEGRLAELPALSIDHLGLDRAALPVLLRLVAGGAKVKASGFGRGDLDVPATLQALADADPRCLLFGTDLPSTRAPRPFMPSDVGVVERALGAARARMALHSNAVDFYRPRET
jgi:predicted TIM-barrel fold metal-dependent hydrolase